VDSLLINFLINLKKFSSQLNEYYRGWVPIKKIKEFNIDTVHAHGMLEDQAGGEKKKKSSNKRKPSHFEDALAEGLIILLHTSPTLQVILPPIYIFCSFLLSHSIWWWNSQARSWRRWWRGILTQPPQPSQQLVLNVRGQSWGDI